MAKGSELNFTLLYVDNLDQSLAYFRDTVGLKHIPEADTDVFRGFGPAVSSLSFGICKPFDDTRKVGQTELYFTTSEFENLYKTMVSQGVRTTPITQVYFGKVFTVDAPDGHLVTMLMPGAPQ